MIENEYIEMIDKEIDKTITGKEIVMLKKYLAENPEAQEYYDNLVRLSKVLHRVNDVDPPAELKNRILNSIRTNRPPAREKENIFQILRTALKPKVNLKYAYAFSAGIMVGTAIFVLFINKPGNMPSLDVSDLSGTIIMSATSGALETADKREFDLGEVYGTIETKFARNVVLAEVDITSQQEIEIVVEYDENDIGFDGFRQLQHLKGSFDIGEKYLRLVHRGKNKYILVFEDKTQTISSMTFKIYSADLIYEKTVSTGKSGE